MNTQKTLSEKQMAALLALLVMVMPLSIDAYLPSLPQIAQDLNTNIHRIEQSLSSFILGVACGQLVGGSLSDIKGRKKIALIGLSIYACSTIGLIFVQSANQLLFLRLIQAIGAGMAAVVVGAIVRDHYEGNKAAQMFALIGIIMMAAPLLAPMIGSIMQAIGGWRLVFAFLLAYSLVVLLIYWRFLPQKHTPQAIEHNIFTDILMRFRVVLRTKPALGFLFFQAASFSSMMVFLTESSFIYMQLHGLTAHQYAWAFGCNIIMMALFNRYTAWHLKRDKNARDILKTGIIVQLLANMALLTCVLLLGLPSLWLMIVLIMMSVGTQGLVVANTQALFMQYFKENSGSANAVLSACQSLIGASVGFVVTLLHNGPATIMPMMMTACTVCGTALLWYFSRQVFTQKC